MRASPFQPPTSLRFRGVSDTLAERHVEGSECCLIHADNPWSEVTGVFVNPRVRVGYSGSAYNAVNPQDRSWLSNWKILTGIWGNRVHRWSTTSMIKDWVMSRRLKSWAASGHGSQEKGTSCLINEMQVLTEGGWAHV
jgi:hypothetical protein